MEPREFVEIRTKRYMAQYLDAFEARIENPLRALHGAEPSRRDIAEIVARIDGVKANFRDKLHLLADDCLDLMPSDVEINAFEPVRR